MYLQIIYTGNIDVYLESYNLICSRYIILTKLIIICMAEKLFNGVSVSVFDLLLTPVSHLVKYVMDDSDISDLFSRSSNTWLVNFVYSFPGYVDVSPYLKCQCHP